MDISSRFSLTDFLAYLFPGILSAVGFYCLLLLASIRVTLENSPKDLTLGVLFLVFSYILGVILSGVIELIANSFRLFYKPTIPLLGFEEDLKKAFRDVFHLKQEIEWARPQFYLCRSVVFEYMPNAVQIIQRQSSLRQLRMNMLPSIFIWMSVGIAWGINMITNGKQSFGFGLILASVLLAILLFAITVDRMRSNDRREQRETYSAFLAGYETGLFKKEKRPTPKATPQI